MENCSQKAHLFKKKNLIFNALVESFRAMSYPMQTGIRGSRGPHSALESWGASPGHGDASLPLPFSEALVLALRIIPHLFPAGLEFPS